MLRESSKIEGNDVDLNILIANSDEGGIPAEKQLVAFAEAAYGFDNQLTSSARDELVNTIGAAGMVDAAGVIANFQRMVRIADGTGIQLDPPVAMVTADIRDELGINDFGSAGNTPPTTFIQRMLGRAISPFLGFLLQKIAKKIP